MTIAQYLPRAPLGVDTFIRSPPSQVGAYPAIPSYTVASDLARVMIRGATSIHITVRWEDFETAHGVFRTDYADYLLDCCELAEVVAGRTPGTTPVILEPTTRLPPWALIDSVTGNPIANNAGKRTNNLGWQILAKRPDDDAFNTYACGISTDAAYNAAVLAYMQAWDDSLNAADPNGTRSPLHFVFGPAMNSRWMRTPENLSDFPGTTDGFPNLGTTPDSFGFGWTAKGHHDKFVAMAQAQGGATFQAARKRPWIIPIANGPSSGGQVSINNYSQGLIAAAAGAVCPQGPSRMILIYESYGVTVHGDLAHGGKTFGTYWNLQQDAVGAWYVHANDPHAAEIHTRYTVNSGVNEGAACFDNVNAGRPVGQDLREYLAFRPTSHASVVADWKEENSPPFAGTMFYTVYVADIDHGWAVDTNYYANLATLLAAHAPDTNQWINQYFNPEPPGTAPQLVQTPRRRLRSTRRRRR